MILRDPVHGLVSFESSDTEIVPYLIDTAEVQRLRRIRQLGVTSVAFPGAEHSRFSHAVGAAFVMKLLLERLRATEEDLPVLHRLTEVERRDALAAALLHDLGHGPLSHLYENAIPNTEKHEVWTERILLDPNTEVCARLSALDAGMPKRVSELVLGRHPKPYLARAVSGAFDVDRCDYLLRDAYTTGVRYGIFDLDWLLRSLRLTPSQGAPPALAIDGSKGLPAIEAFLLARYFMFQQVYMHKATRSSEWMIRTLLARAAHVIASGGEVPEVPRAIRSAARREPILLSDYLELDDALLSVSMRSWESASDRPLADLSARVRARKLFKSLELFGEQATPDGQARILSMSRDVATRNGLDPGVYVGIDVSEFAPYASDAELEVVFAKGSPRPLSEVSFLLGRLAEQTVRRVRLMFAPELREALTRALSLG